MEVEMPNVIIYAYLVFFILSATGCTHTMEMSNCKEMFAEFPVDATLARKNVPPEYNIRTDTNGRATLLLMVQDCEKGLLDGLIRIKPMRMSNIWMEIEGPVEVGPALPGTTSSLPTAYYYILPHQMDSSLAHVSLNLTGIDSQLVKEIKLGDRSGDQRLGHVIEKSPSRMYQWTETSQLWATPTVVTGRRKFYRQYGWAIKRSSTGIVTCNSSFLGEGRVILTASPASAIGLLQLGTTLPGTVHPVEMNCHAEINVHIE
jgi:hypothetical protein